MTAISGAPRLFEVRVITRIAMPLSLAYLAEFVMFMVTKIVIGHVGYLELAAAGLAIDLAHEVLVILMGGLSVVGVLMAHSQGGERSHEVGHALRQGLIVATLVGLAAIGLILNLDIVMAWADQDPVIIRLAVPFLEPLAWMVLPVLWFSVLRIFVAMNDRGTYILVITVAAAVLNYVLALGLVDGRFGMPTLGYIGGGWAIVAVSWFMFVALVAAIWWTPILRGFGVFHGRLQIDAAVCADIVRLGVPVCAIVTIEAGLFAAVSLLSGYIGTTELAVYSVIMGWVGIPFVLAHGVAEAAMIRVAYNIGNGRIDAARRSGMISMVLGLIVIALLIIIPVGFPEAIVGVFLDRADPGFNQVSILAAKLFFIVGLFQIFDGLQVIASYSLRGLRDTVIPVWLAGFGYWVLGVGGGAFLAFNLGLGAVGLWWGLALGLFATAILLTARFHLLTRTNACDH